jgi:hypothetical protein
MDSSIPRPSWDLYRFLLESHLHPEFCWSFVLNFVFVDDSIGTGKELRMTPRRGPGYPDEPPDEWERLVESQRTADDPPVFVRFRNGPSGRVINADPRMLPEALQSRGVRLRNFKLV